VTPARLNVRLGRAFSAFGVVPVPMNDVPLARRSALILRARRAAGPRTRSAFSLRMKSTARFWGLPSGNGV
jgi:hypothetical protein